MNTFYCKQALQFLLKDGKWRTAASITRLTGYTAVEIRKTCQQYTQLCISSGEGYKLLSLATNCEIDNSLRILMSRANKINKRARSLQRFSLEKRKAGIRALNRLLDTVS
jgi:hypothetical protein